MPSRSSLPAWLAVLSIVILASLGLWIRVRGRQALEAHLDATTYASVPNELVEAARPIQALDDPHSRESIVRAPLEPAQPTPKKKQRFSGRVTDSRGDPCESATVLLYSPNWSMTVDFTRTDADGAFELRYPYAGDFEVLARNAGVGTCDRFKIELDDAPEQQRVELVLNRPDWLAGRLVDGAARPLAGVELWAFPAVFASADSAWLFRWRMCAESRTLRGECSGTTETDGKGRFRFVDLEPGAYFIARRDRLDPPRDPRVPHSTGESAIELVEDHVWLSLRCRGAPGASVFCAPVTMQGPSDHLLKPLSDSEPSSAHLFEVEACRVYRCGFFDPRLGFVEEELSMPCRGGTVVHEFELPDRRSAGRLALRISVLWRPREDHIRRVRIRSAASGVLLMTWTQGEAGGADLPAGEFVLEVADPPARGHEVFMRDEALGEALLTRRRIVIRPDSVTRIDVNG